ncbi:MAG: DUF72 domain-containing protein [Ignavibacteria bacterium]|nr:DUF72 domain-containing protein [Ignavibacteria bacterium]
MRLYYGCSQWGYESWRGSIYPENSKSSDFLHYYSRKFNTVELNSTFYNGAEPQSILRWKNKTPDGFRFCPKVPRSVSHEKLLSDTANEMRDFLSGVNMFGDKLGTVFLQLSNSFGESDFGILESFLSAVPDDFSLSVEPRLGLISRKEPATRLLEILQATGKGIVITDSVETKPYINNLKLTSHTAFIRFIAYGHSTDRQRIDEWFVQLGKWRDKGLPRSYFFLHFPSESSDTELVHYFTELSEEFAETVK